MASRRLRGALAGFGAGLSNYGQMAGQQQMLLQRQAIENQAILERQRQEDQRQIAQSLIPQILSGQVSPEVLSPELRSALNGVDLNALRPSPARMMSPLMEKIESAKTVTDLPSEAGIFNQLAALGLDVSPVLQKRQNPAAQDELPSSNFMPSRNPLVSNVMGQRKQRIEDLLAEEARKRGQTLTKVDSVDASGRKQVEFVPESELSGRQFFTEPTAEQIGQQKQTELLKGELSPQVTSAKARQESAAAGARRRAELAAEASRLGLTQQQQQAALALSDNFTNDSKDYFTIASNFRKIATVAKQPSAAGDLSLIFSYMRMLDPGSTVREGEFANAQNAAGVPDRIVNLYNKALNGERLAPEQRRDFLKQAGNIYQSSAVEHKQRVDLYKQRSRQFNVPDFLVVREPFADLDEGANQSNNNLPPALRPQPSHGSTRKFEIVNVRPAGGR